MAQTVLRGAGLLATGLLVGAIGTIQHRSYAPWGVVAGLALVAVAGVLARAIGGFAGYGVYALGVAGVVAAMWTYSPGGDILLPNLGNLGQVWLLGVPVVLALVPLAPPGWFRAEPRP